MNRTIELLQHHRSIRRYKSDALAVDQLHAIIEAAQMASTSSNMQAYSIVGVGDPEKKRKLAAIAGNQQHVEQCPMFLVWCADLHRIDVACANQGATALVGSLENMLVATVDTALAAQNAAIAAESLGLGITYVGAIRSQPQQVTELLELPPLVFPLFGMCVGVPDHTPTQRPRLARRAIYHENSYSDADYGEAIAHYDEAIRHYAATRDGGTRDSTWSRDMAARTAQPYRPIIRTYLRSRGFDNI
ncbi:MAG: oxygen-insensitive NADPH nitroreductase [Paenibacillaceae bacterium]|nr:oxygen-insensitive NADPH nitroreductase [Paenibacillaceae bacterium]